MTDKQTYNAGHCPDVNECFDCANYMYDLHTVIMANSSDVFGCCRII